MSLDWSVDKVDDWKTLQEDDYERSVTQALVFGTMAVGLYAITAKNVDTWMARLHQMSTVAPERNFITEHDGEDWVRRMPTRAEVERRIGLSTNASSLTDAAWKKRVFTMLDDEERRRHAEKRWQETKEVAAIARRQRAASAS